MTLLQPNTHLKPKDVKKHILLVGGENVTDVITILTPLSSFKEIATNKGFHTYDCKIDKKGYEFTLCLTGVGPSNTEIAVNELAKCGGRLFIRAGTSGSLRRNHVLESVIITSEALRFDGVSDLYVNKNFKATPSDSVNRALIASAQDLQIDYYLGKTISTSSFYAMGGIYKEGRLEYNGYVPHRNYQPRIFDKFKQLLSKEKFSNIEMEAATLLTLSRILKLKAGVVCGLSNYIPWKPNEQTQHTYKSLENSIHVALRAIERLKNTEKS
ncbi:MAG: putative Uridine phosphorylase [Promethearchaeota archaeon]|nr:MAG: putative Uridine phosphorylase [Candidatus Lokiarchaeota archaeon]